MDENGTQDLPEPSQFELDGHIVTINYEYNWGISARICMPPALLRLVEEVFVLASQAIHRSVSLYAREYVVVDEGGNEMVSSPVPSSLQYYYDEHVKRERREQNYDTLNADLIELMEAVQELREHDLPVTEIETALRAARDAVDNLYGYWNPSTFGEAQGRLNRVRKLIAELEGSLVTVLVRGLMSGDIYHRDVYWNRQVRQRQLSLWIRVGGDTPLHEYLGEDAIDLLTDDRLAAIYTELLLAAGAKNLTDVNNTSLALDQETYAPEWLLHELVLNPAPDRIPIFTSRGTVTAQITYSLREDGGVQVPTGTARITLNEFNRARTIPKLPHGIELMLELTVAGEVVVTGPVGDVLTKRVKSYRGGQRRSVAAPPSDLIRTKPVPAGAVPPWGPKTVRWR